MPEIKVCPTPDCDVRLKEHLDGTCQRPQAVTQVRLLEGILHFWRGKLWDVRVDKAMEYDASLRRERTGKDEVPR
jgi:hypothetical protein